MNSQLIEIAEFLAKQTPLLAEKCKQKLECVEASFVIGFWHCSVPSQLLKYKCGNKISPLKIMANDKRKYQIYVDRSLSRLLKYCDVVFVENDILCKLTEYNVRNLAALLN